MCCRRRTSAAEILKRGTVLHFIYIYIKHMGICFYTDWSLFQIYNGYQIKTTTTTLHGKYCQPSHTINTGRAELCGVLIRKRTQNK